MDQRFFAKDLDLIGGLMGTDKSSADHDYLVHYDRLFREHIQSAFNFLEIGIFKGASLAMWHEYFDQATIIGVDIQQDCRCYARDRIMVEIGSQEDPGFLADLVRRYPPRIIVDDGSHLAHHVIFTFETLFPALEPGGIYVIEDLHFHAGAMREHSRGYSKICPIDYFSSLSRMIVTNELDNDKRWGFQKYAMQSIDEIIFFGHAAAVRKKALQANRAERAAAAINFAERSGTAEAWERVSLYLAGNGDKDRAISSIAQAIRTHPIARFYRQLALLYADTGDMRAATDTIQTSIEQAGDQQERGECLEHLGNFFIAQQRIPEALAAFREASPLVGHPVVRDRIADKVRQHAGA